MLRFLTKTKGQTFSKAAHKIVGYYLKKKQIGELKAFSIDTTSKKLIISFVPRFFTDVLTIEAKNYNILKDAQRGKNYLTFDNITTSNNWNDSRFKALIKDRKIEIPAKYSKFINLIG